MFRSIFTVLSTLILAAGILTTSVFHASSVSYSFGDLAKEETILGVEDEGDMVDYELALPGEILPGHPLWPLVAVRDRFWFWFTLTPEGKAKASQILADRRLVASQRLFEEGNPEMGFSTLTKAEKYLESVLKYIKEAEERGVVVDNLLKNHANASLKHTEEIKKLLKIAPEDAKPEITKVGDEPVNTFNNTRDALNERGLSVPNNPFGSN